jgi:hypothetical protein
MDLRGLRCECTYKVFLEKNSNKCRDLLKANEPADPINVAKFLTNCASLN